MHNGSGSQPTVLVVFGITGDLSNRYLLPALAEIKKADRLPKEFRLLGISRRKISLDEALGTKKADLAKNTGILQMDLDSKSDYKKLKSEISNKKGQQVIFYLAVPPGSAMPIVCNLGEVGLNSGETKLLLEKPFGTDFASAKELVTQTRKFFKEKQTYRIDHYLAKEVAQNIAVFLGSNVLFKRVWNKQFIEYIEIVAAEKIPVGTRAVFYEQTGALRDIIQSHLLQLAALTLMEPVGQNFDFAQLPKRRLAALKKLYVPGYKLQEAVRGQYLGYKKEINTFHSTTETFAALQIFSKAARWTGVPIYLATGKNLDRKLTQILINFKRDSKTEANSLILRIQPNEGIELDFWVKEPGYERKLRKLTHSFTYQYHFKNRFPDAYEQIVVDAIAGSQSLFASSDEVLESWRILQPVLENWSGSDSKLKSYKPGSTIKQVLESK